jgi:hypothetical protein
MAARHQVQRRRCADDLFVMGHLHAKGLLVRTVISNACIRRPLTNDSVVNGQQSSESLLDRSLSPPSSSVSSGVSVAESNAAAHVSPVVMLAARHRADGGEVKDIIKRLRLLSRRNLSQPTTNMRRPRKTNRCIMDPAH